jgi:hypothetical protein
VADARPEMRRLVDVAAPYWAGEAEIVRTYFARPRSRDEHLYFLRAQAHKETRHLRALPQHQQDELVATGTVADHPEGPAGARKLGEEMKHFRLLMDLMTEVAGTPASLADLRELPEETKLQALRQPYREGSALDQAIANFTEGGGGAIYWVLARLEGGEFERRAAAVFRVIWDDEIVHGPGEIHTIGRLATTAADWERAREVVRAICHQRLHMRNEMFGFPLSPARIAEIAAGEIEPWATPIPI